MNILISGGTGFVGGTLTKALTNKEHNIFIITRSSDRTSDDELVSFITLEELHTLPRIDAIINLAGESLFGYWTTEKKENILSSRINITRALVEFVEKRKQRPSVFISGSAVGFYGTSDDQIFTEETLTPGDDFLSEVASTWEASAQPVEKLGVRTVYTRFGVILGDAGSFPLMELPVKLFIGGKVGNGHQWLSWVHLDDVVKSIIECLENEALIGPVNVTAPEPVRNDHFMKAIASSLGRPYWFPTPALAIRLALGEMSMLIVDGQYVIPQKLLDVDSFEFSYPNIKRALKKLHHSK